MKTSVGKKKLSQFQPNISVKFYPINLKLKQYKNTMHSLLEFRMMSVSCCTRLLKYKELYMYCILFCNE